MRLPIRGHEKAAVEDRNVYVDAHGSVSAWDLRLSGGNPSGCGERADSGVVEIVLGVGEAFGGGLPELQALKVRAVLHGLRDQGVGLRG